MGKFKTVTTRNNWGNVEYYTGKKNPKRLTLVDGEVVGIKWPDGDEWLTNVLVKKHRTMVSDMGHDYPVETELYFVTTEVHGVEVEVGLHKLKVYVDG